MTNRQQNIEDFDFSIVDFKGHVLNFMCSPQIKSLHQINTVTTIKYHNIFRKILQYFRN